MRGRDSMGWSGRRRAGRSGLPRFKFNYRMQQGVSGCPTIAFFMSVWGADWKQALAETYLLNEGKNGAKSIDDIITDIWNVLYSFSSQEKLKAFAIDKLQLAEQEAELFAKAKIIVFMDERVYKGRKNFRIRIICKKCSLCRYGFPYD